MKARLFLFYGTDSAAASKAVRAWRHLFEKKHGEATIYTIEADEVSSADCARTLAGYLEGQTLFSVPKLILVRRVLAQEKGNSRAHSKAVLEVLKDRIDTLDSDITVALFEDRNIGASHPLLTSFQAWKEQGVAGIKYFPLPTERQLPQVVRSYIEEAGGAVDPAAITWLQKAYAEQGARARLAKKVKVGDELLQDDRGWWLYGLLDSAIVLSLGRPISVEILQSLQRQEDPAVKVFDIVSTITARRWKDAYRLLRGLEDEGDEGLYFSFYAALRWQLKRDASRLGLLAPQGMRLLAEIEIIVKNFPVRHAWLAEQLVRRLEQASGGGGELPIVPARKLWMAHLLRS